MYSFKCAIFTITDIHTGQLPSGHISDLNHLLDYCFWAIWAEPHQIQSSISTKARPPIEFLNLGVANPLITQMLLSDNFSMNTKFVDLTELYKLGSHKKIVTQKHFGDQGVCHTKIEKFYWTTHFKKK